jgi:Ca-activated chloride channel homolog
MKRIVCLALFTALLCNSGAFALGALYARRPLSTETSTPLWLEKYDASVTITDQIAVTHVDQTFKNETSNRLEGVFIFPLPDNAVVTELALWINGVRQVAKIMGAASADSAYQAIVRRSIDPALLQYMGKNVFKLQVFPIEANGNTMSERRIEITYAELLPYRLQEVDYTFFMKTVNLSPKPVQRASIVFECNSQKKILSFSSPTAGSEPKLSIIKKSDTQYVGTYGNENTNSEKDFTLAIKYEHADYSLKNLTYSPRTDSLKMFFDTTGDNPYYLLWVTPPDTAQAIKKNVVFVADISSSMSGSRIIQLRAALKSMIAILGPSDMFNIIPFSTSITSFKPTLVTTSAENKTAASEFVNQLTEKGLTDIEDAFKTACATAWDDTSVNAIVFLTDGQPTWPAETNAARVVDTVKKCNSKGASIFTFGIGEEVNDTLLKRLARENSGFYTKISTDDSISGVMEKFMHAISYPLIKNITMSYGGMETYDVMPNPMPNLYAGTQLTLLGRYKTAGEYQIAFKGKRGKDSMAISEKLAFPSGAGSHPFVPRMWASAKIDALLDDISLYGQKKELVDAVKALGLKYSIVTPYTSLLVIEPIKITSTLPSEDKTVFNTKPLLLSTQNPVKSSTTIRYFVPRLSSPQTVWLKIYDAKGRLVRNLVNDVAMGGNFLVKWDVKNNAGSFVPTGAYFAVLETSCGLRMMITLKVVR